MPPKDTATNAPDVTVSELSQALKRTVEDAFGYVRVRGEISGYRGPHSSGHAYFALKDEGAKIDAVVWRGSFSKLRFKPEEGMEVIATGRLTTYPGKSAYQIVVDALEPAGVGALMALLEERRKKLAAEGLFDRERKRPLPYLPEVIGVVTSPTGAVIRDILHRVADRFPRRVLVWPVRVQGDTAAAEVAAAIRGFNALPSGGPIPRPDVLLVARGGGSLEDLWAFNEEIVVRAAAESAIPLVSAVGHETDTTLIDFASDVRAPTPTAAAEMVTPVRAELLAVTAERGARLKGAMLRGLDARRVELRAAARALPSLEALVQSPRQRLDHASARLGPALAANAGRHRARLAAAGARLSPATLTGRVALLRERLGGHEARLARAFAGLTARRRDRLEGVWKLARSLSYEGVLERGYALVETADGAVRRRAADVVEGEALRLVFVDGRREAVAGGASADAGAAPEDAPPPRKEPRTRPKPVAPAKQADLFG
ncbi:exodeoxyribonuclease 7 large subunit [Methylopila jiangsuensis]|uniref:Exodeoxyribonuclease 7 large subunit n=1 Tax=Methylopila jiangsuensis TaxID=586230 RepID=A0A9W6JFP6_9HYPH|nr:exodeoxyribonuclease VII large subunit [Methylopila jiangsuensis]MDR6286911.1 exodeoxyribonuclease VII large subunit [Methylopila jiangsuensis]GLK76740.1 exodeoxyribonuclease 7 large subunit [Methylopila jiangsuensis]